jgi:hypothetical protein
MDMLKDVGEVESHFLYGYAYGCRRRPTSPNESHKKNTNVQYFVISVMGPNIPIYDKLRVPVATPSKE